ncbi:peptide/nickel transport system ATP-binding protein/oligopeptide transport system ATP-binding protein [Planifilum fimeticola]|uniref:Peptide/nickel transport system ATP-binding protein/oligopeptide transport system ATP-binding protein n=1 Tax=Planifilum fimeticola TaxID=201975 RepID=A0A2T0LHF4_9BACL|nr:ABC transporter ATP-binding protein [Planifilum fimeticola]PRX41802.1 peptide/nickel transport system ATP-binding protein/oligopeptide transport system ATP-binding protein [Planifilum fimeticola]
MSEPLLQIRNLKTYFFQDDGVVPAVDGIDLEVKRKETLALVGESGCGKSITSFSILKLLPERGKIVEGEILFDGKEIRILPEEEMVRIRGNEISMIFQEPMTSLNPVMTIGDQIAESLILHQRLDKKAARLRTVELLKLVGFPRAEEIVDEYPHQLSGGMRQRAMIAMAVACNPKLLIADEPTTALDVTIQAQILELMREVKEKFDTSILLITHDLGVVAEMADRVVVMYAGRVVEEADVIRLFEQPAHPYTEGLLKSVPSLEEEQKRLYSIRGNVPSPDEWPKGCKFAPRCEKAWEKCRLAEPELLEIAPGHRVRCFLHESGEEDKG